MRRAASSKGEASTSDPSLGLNFNLNPSNKLPQGHAPAGSPSADEELELESPSYKEFLANVAPETHASNLKHLGLTASLLRAGAKNRHTLVQEPLPSEALVSRLAPR